MKTLFTILIVSLQFAAHGQVVSRFIWNSNPLTKAAAGPNGTSVNSTAYFVAVPAPVNFAINPGTPTKDIDLTIPASPTFDLPGIDIDLYFRKEESEASFFKRGSAFNFGILNGQLYVNFSTNKGSNSGTTNVTSGSVYALPDDHAFHHYRFKYDNNTGIANLYVDDAIVYTYNGTAGYTLNWGNASDVVIGSKMDATGRNVPVLGNMTIQNPAQASTLPVSLLSFSVASGNNQASITWSTTKEFNAARFVVEYSENGSTFNALTSVDASGSYDLVRNYRAVDNLSHSGTVFYRLRMVDIDGTFTFSEVRKLSFGAASSIGCFPNPATDHVTLSLSNVKAGNFRYVLMTAAGNIIDAATVRLENGS